MTAMTCKLNGLFSIGEDFDDEDLLATDWTGPAAAAAHREQQQQGGAAETLVFTAAGHTGAPCLRKLSSSATPHPPSSAQPPPHPPSPAQPPPPSPAHLPAQDDFDDWDVDLADLEECDQLFPPPAAPPPAAPPPTDTVHLAPSAKALRAPTHGGVQTGSGGLRELSTTGQTSGSSGPSGLHRPPPSLSTPLRPPPQSLTSPQQPPRPRSTPGPSPRGRGLFDTLPCTSSVAPPPLSPLHTPVLTNRLVQLVSASSKPKKRPRSEPQRPRARRFPGPAGVLPQQPQGQSLDRVVVSAPVTPAHGAVARSPSQGSGSQADEEEFSGGAWAAMKAETGLDERNPSCFLHSYSVVMVLRKAALKQLAQNKVPNMAVLLKSIVHTHADARAVFRDPTGEIQGTVHRRLLEDRVEELQVGAVLLLKQVGVFSPSHRNHYLNVTPNNLLRIYGPHGVGLTSTQPPPLLLESAGGSVSAPRGPVSQMHLVFDEEDDEGQEEGRDPRAPTDSRASGRGPPHPGPSWDEDDDLDELLGQLPEDTYSL